MNPALARARRTVVNVVLAAVIAVSLVLVVPGVLGLERYVITGGSMSPTYEVGTVVFEETVPVQQLAVGDVITYLPPAGSGVDHLVTHRLSAVTADPTTGQRLYRTQGDANAAADPWTFRPTAPTQPRVVAALPLLGWLFIALADAQLRLLVIGVPALAIFLLSGRDLVRALRPSRPAPAEAPDAGVAPATETARIS